MRWNDNRGKHAKSGQRRENSCNTRSAARFPGISSAFSNNVVCSTENIIKITNNPRNSQENMSNIVINTMPADGLAPNGARPSAVTVLIKF